MMHIAFRWFLALAGVLLLVSFVLWPTDQGAEAPLLSPATLLTSEPGFVAEANAQSDDGALPSMLDEQDWGSGDEDLEPIALADAKNLSLQVYSDAGYQDESGRYMVDLLEQDYAYLSLIVTDEDGRPVVGAEPEFSLSGTSQLLSPDQVSARAKTDASGTLDFAIIGGAMGLDEVTVAVGEASTELRVNVISLRATGFPTPAEIEGGLAWRDLMGARIQYSDDGMTVEFPKLVQDAADELVKLSGFMMPLDPDLLQRRFLLTSNPPSCFFHIPGGPAGAVEVLAPDGIETSWNPVVLEGRFEPVTTGEYGVIYRLHDATLVEL